MISNNLEIRFTKQMLTFAGQILIENKATILVHATEQASKYQTKP